MKYPHHVVIQLIRCVCLLSVTLVASAVLIRQTNAQTAEFTQNAGGATAVTVDVPLGNYAGRGISLPISLHYSSRGVWRMGFLNTVPVTVDGYQINRSVVEAIYAEHSTAGWTTSLDVPTIEWPKLNDRYWYDGKSYARGYQSPYTFRVARVFIHMPDGSTHELRKSDAVYQDTNVVETGGSFYAVDGSRMRYDSSGETTGTLYLADGTRYIFDGSTVQCIDRNGNTLSYNLANRQWTDTLGRTLNMPWPANPAAADYTYSLPAINGGSISYTLKFKVLSDVLLPDTNGQTQTPLGDYYLPNPAAPPSSVNLPQGQLSSSLFNSDYSDGDGSNQSTYTYVVGRGQLPSGNFNPPVLAEIDLPNGTNYRFFYNAYGELDKVIYPTGGYQRYQYGGVPMIGQGAGTQPYNEGSRGLTSRWTSPSGTGTDESQWQIESWLDYGYHVRVTAPDASGLPNGTRTETILKSDSTGKNNFGLDYAWNGSPIEERVYAPQSEGGAMLRRTLTDYEQSSVTNNRPSVPNISNPGTYTAYRNAKPIRTVSLILDTGGDALAASTTFDYDATYQFTVGLDQTSSSQYQFATVDQTTAQTAPISSIPTGALVRSTQTSYLTNDANYRSQNILGLASAVTIQDALGQTVAQTTMSYDEAAYPLLPYASVPSWSDPATSYRGNLTTVSHWLNTTSTWLQTHAQYDQCGSVRNRWDTKGNQSQIEYSSNYAYAFPTLTRTAVPDPNGQTGSATALQSTTVFDFNTGLATSATDANSITSQPEYNDPLLRPTRAVLATGNSAQSQSATEYDDTNKTVTGKSDLASFNDGTLQTKTLYDGIGRTVEARTYESDSSYIAVQTQYDKLGHAYKVSNPFAPWKGETPVWTTSDFDALGRVTTVTTPDGATVTNSYSGNTVTVTDQAGKKRRSLTDALGRVVRVDEPDNDNGALDDVNGVPVQSTFYSYDVLGNLRQVTQGSQQRFYMYDSLSRLIRARTVEQNVNTSLNLTDPITGNSQWTAGYQYDAEGNLTQKTDARGVVANYAYDALNRNTSVTYTDGTPTVHRYYDSATNGKGRLYWEETVGVSASVIDAYDALGRPTQYRQRFWMNGAWGSNFTTTASYDKAGHVITESYPSGHAVTYGYDGAGRMTTFTGYLGDGTQRTYATGTSYSSLGGMKQEQFGTDIALYHKLHYNVRGQLNDIRASTVPWQTDEWNWNRGGIVNYYSTADLSCSTNQCRANSGADNNGNIIQSQHWIPANDQMTSYNWTEDRFTYDSLNRLKSGGEYHNGLATQDFAQAYDYDRWGNRTIDYNNTSSNVSRLQFGVDTNTNRLSVPTGQTGAMHYDAAGNLDIDTYSGAAISRTYDANNRMTHETQENNYVAGSYTYDGDGKRIKRIVNGTETRAIYGLGGELLAEYAANAAPTSPQKEYGYRNGELLITAEASPAASTNYAAAAGNVGTASSSGTYQNNSNYDISAVTNGDRKGLPFGNHIGYWASPPYASTSNPQWAEIDFSTSKSINEIDVVGLQDNVSNPIEPTATLVSNNYANKDFQVQYWDGSSWAIVPGGDVTDNDLVWRKFTFANVTTTKVRVVFTRTTAIVAYLTELEVWGNNTPPSVDVASAANGGNASSSGTYQNNSNYGITAVSNGDRKGLPFTGNSGYWASPSYVSTSNPQWAEVDFASSKSINEIDVVGLQDNVINPIEPTATLTSANYANIDFQVQYWNADTSAWTIVPGGNVTDNNLVWRKFTFNSVTTNKIRVVLTRTTAVVAYLTELEAWGFTPPPSTNVAASSTGGQTTASGTYANNTSYDISAVTNGDRKGLPFGSNSGYWASPPYVSTSNPQWAEVDFASSKLISEIDVVGLQDNISNPIEPTSTLVSANYANIDFQVQYWKADTSAWTIVPGGNVTDNTLVWRKFTFSPVTTSKIRVVFTRTTAIVAYLTEIEAWSNDAAPASSANIHWLLTDQLGTPRMVFDQTGSLASVSRHDYLPFGEEIGANVGGRTTAQGYTSSDAARQHFTGYEADAETGLNFAQARYQSPAQGRFTSVDPLGASANIGNPQSFNRYSFVNNDPINLVDPTGMMLSDIGVYQTTDPREAQMLEHQSLRSVEMSINAEYAISHGGSVSYSGNRASFLSDNASQNLLSSGEVPFNGYLDDAGILTWSRGEHYTLPQEKAPTSRDGDFLSTLFGGSSPMGSSNGIPLMIGGLNPLYHPIPWNPPPVYEPPSPPTFVPTEPPPLPPGFQEKIGFGPKGVENMPEFKPGVSGGSRPYLAIWNAARSFAGGFYGAVSGTIDAVPIMVCAPCMEQMLREQRPRSGDNRVY